MTAPESVRRSGPVAHATGLRTTLAVGLLVFGAIDLAVIHTVLLPHHLASRAHRLGASPLRAGAPPLAVVPRESAPVARASNQSSPAVLPPAPSEPPAKESPPAEHASGAGEPAAPPKALAAAAPATAPVPDEPPEKASATAASAEKLDSPSLFFVQNTAWLSPESRESLDALAVRLKDDPGLDIVLVGHTDDVGTPKVNLALSLRRALRARAWLLERGVAEDRIEVRGLGSSQPAANGASREARAKNRRVEIAVSERSR